MQDLEIDTEDYDDEEMWEYLCEEEREYLQALLEQAEKEL